MKFVVGRQLAYLAQRFFGIHPEVITLLGSGFRLTNPSQAVFPSENLPFTSKVIASGLWNYCFFQFYRNFVGPYWVERQYNPVDVSFIPRAGSLMSLNLTHRTWMGFRGPLSSTFSMIDPAGAISPIVGFYSIEVGLARNGQLYLPSRGDVDLDQYLDDDLPFPVTTIRKDDAVIRWRVSGSSVDDGKMPVLIDASTQSNDWSLVIGIRPFNPEGAALVDHIGIKTDSGFVVSVNHSDELRFLRNPDQVSLSNLEGGDAYFQKDTMETATAEINCQYGVAQAAFQFQLKKGKDQLGFLARCYERITKSQLDRFDAETEVATLTKTKVRDLSKPREKIKTHFILRKEQPLSSVYGTSSDIIKDIALAKKLWQTKLSEAAKFDSANEIWNKAARIHTGFLLSLQTEKKITPGVFTYRQFWFRDAAYMLSALSSWNLTKEAKTVIATYGERQMQGGFFKSHEGEWDSNGQAIWTITDYYRKTSDQLLLEALYPSMLKGAQWIIKQRKTGFAKKMMPAGFSAEHLGPADYYYWDNLWSIAGLRELLFAASVLGRENDATVQKVAFDYTAYRNDFLEVTAQQRRTLGLITAAPTREIDAGAIGSVVHLYPLDLDLLSVAEAESLVETIYGRYFVNDLFFHPIIHSGYNIYLTLHLAQSFLYLGRADIARRIFEKVLSVRSALSTYPEAVHPATGGGVMGDGFHGWASADLLQIMQAFVIREQRQRNVADGRIIDVFQGLQEGELFGRNFSFGPFRLSMRQVQIDGHLSSAGGSVRLRFEGDLQPNDRLRFHLPVMPKEQWTLRGCQLIDHEKSKLKAKKGIIITVGKLSRQIQLTI